MGPRSAQTRVFPDIGYRPRCSLYSLVSHSWESEKSNDTLKCDSELPLFSPKGPRRVACQTEHFFIYKKMLSHFLDRLKKCFLTSCCALGSRLRSERKHFFNLLFQSTSCRRSNLCVRKCFCGD